MSSPAQQACTAAQRPVLVLLGSPSTPLTHPISSPPQVVSVVGMSVGFGVFRGVWTSASAKDANALGAWFLIPIFQVRAKLLASAWLHKNCSVLGILSDCLLACGNKGGRLELPTAPCSPQNCLLTHAGHHRHCHGK